MPGFDPIPFTFSENSNYWQDSLLDVFRQNIAGLCQQTFEKKKFVDNAQQYLPLHLSQTFQPIFEFQLKVKVKVMESNPGYLLKSFLLYVLENILVSCK